MRRFFNADTRLARTYGAGEGTRTLDPKLGKLVLYQLSYARFANRNVSEPGRVVNLTSMLL